MNKVYERDIEAHLVEQCKARGWGCYKFTSPGRRNVPDRIVIVPGGVVVFVELKAPRAKPTVGQEREHARLRALGCRVLVIDSIEGVDRLTRGMQ